MNTLKWIVSVWDDNVYFYLSKTVPVLMILAWIKNTAVIRLTHPNVQQKLSAHSAASLVSHFISVKPNTKYDTAPSAQFGIMTPVCV